MPLSSRIVLPLVVAGIVLAAVGGYLSRSDRSPAFGGITERKAPVRSAAETPAPGADARLAVRVEGLARQIHEINANIANLGSKNAAALRFRAALLAAYRLAWAELTRHQIDFGDPAAQEAVAVLPAAKP